METSTEIMTNDRQDETSGKFVPKYEDADFLAALEDLGGAASTAEVAEAAGAKKRTTHYRLDKLRDQGRVTSRTVGGSLLWMLEDDTEAGE